MNTGKSLIFALGLAACGLLAAEAAAADGPVEKALELSKQTGLPILAVAGSKT